MEKIINEIKELIKEKHIKQAKELYEKHKEELDEYYEAQKFQSVEWHEYRGYNKLFLSMFSKPWKYGTFKQWISNERKVKKGERGSQIFVPIFLDKDKEEIRYMKTVYIFHESQTEQIKKED